MKTRPIAFALTAFLCLAGPALAASSDEKAVLAADEAFYKASLEHKAQAWRDFADKDANAAGVHGPQAIGEVYDKIYGQPGFSLAWSPRYAKVVGDIGVSSGRYRLHDGKGNASKGSYVTVWQRQKDGNWRYVWDGGTKDK